MSSIRRYISEIRNNSQALKYMIKHGDFKSVFPHIWARLFVQNVGPGLIHPLYRKFPQLAPYPREIEVEVTTRCHLKCIHCERTYWNEEIRDLSLGEFRYIVDQFPHLKWINATGEGSSFLNKDYIAMLSYVKSKGIFVKFVESFTALKTSEMKALINLGINRIVVSMEGATKETYESIRIGASFQRVIGNLKKFDELKKQMGSPLPELSFRYVLMANNYQELPNFIRLIGKLGVGQTINIVGTLDYKNIERLSIRSNKAYLKELEKIAERNEIYIPLGATIRRPPITRCTAWVQPYIMMGGYVMPCCGVLMSNRRNFLRNNALGNIFERPFREIWNSPEYVKFRRAVPRKEGALHPLCVGCRSFDTLGRE